MTIEKTGPTCPECGYTLDSHISDDGETEPAVGDFGICIKCGQVSVFSINQKLRPMTEHDISQMPLDEVVRMQKIVRQIREGSE